MSPPPVPPSPRRKAALMRPWRKSIGRARFSAPILAGARWPVDSGNAARHPRPMLLWAGFVSILLGILALAIDRRLAHFIYDHVSARAHKALDSITHYAKAAHWLAAAV